MGTVLLTGGSGFIASHILRFLLERGYDVVTTVRSYEQGDRILESYSSLSEKRLRYVIVEDITRQKSMDQMSLMMFCTHKSSGASFERAVRSEQFKDPVNDMLNPAIKGTNAVLKAVKSNAPIVKRVVLTSSFVAMLNPQEKLKIYDETSWSPVTWDQAIQNPRLTYSASKALAEKAAWEFMETEKPDFDLVSINPPLVLGPLIHHLPSLDQVNTSNQRIRDMALGKFADGSLPPTGIFLWVDVRDVALAHVRAIEVPAAGGLRFLVTAGHLSNKAVAEAIAESHPEIKLQLPAQLVDDTPTNIFGYDNKKTVDILSVHFLSLNESFKNRVDSLVSFI